MMKEVRCEWDGRWKSGPNSGDLARSVPTRLRLAGNDNRGRLKIPKNTTICQSIRSRCLKDVSHSDS